MLLKKQGTKERNFSRLGHETHGPQSEKHALLFSY